MAHPTLHGERNLNDLSLQTNIEELEGNYGISLEKAAELCHGQDWQLMEQILIYRRELLKETLLVARPDTVPLIQGAAQALQLLLDLPSKLEGIKTLKTNHQTPEHING